ncbi:MAG: allantoicase [Gammaproteobacteria bacterium]|nr:allantoicase [Gammaproteobacteria bacterium]
MKNNDKPVPDFVERGIDLGHPSLGTKIIDCSDDFFADRTRLLNPEPPVWIPDKYDDNGKWMDGWESRRRRNGGHDYLVIKLGRPGILFGVNIDTSHFTGNYPMAASLEGTYCDTQIDENSEWVPLVTMTELQGDSEHYLEVDSLRVWTHIRFNIFPDGGVARLRLYGRVYCDWESEDPDALHDFANSLNGGRVIGWNDAHFGHPNNLLNDGDAQNMGDAWETRRRREPGYDWCVIELGHRCLIKEIVVDTAFFKGNYPHQFSLQAAEVMHDTRKSLITRSIYWPEIFSLQPLQMDCKNHFKVDSDEIGPVNYIRFNIFPDGGVSRLRVFGKLA